MKNPNLKKVVSLVAGSLVIALVVSILPGGFFASAAEVSKREARNVAIDYINDESAEIVEINDDGLDEDKPYYKVKIKTDKSEYTVIVDAETAAIKLDSRKRLDNDEVVTSKDFDNFENFEKFIEEDDFDDYGIDKPTEEADLNEYIRDGKKVAIADYKAAKDDLDKDDDNYKDNKTIVMEEFKTAKDTLKEIKKEAKAEIKLAKIDDDNDDDDDDKEKDKEKDKKDIVVKAKIDEKQALIIALKKISVPVTTDDVTDLAKLDSETDYAKLFGLTDLDIEIDDDNPPAYELNIKYDKKEYEITIHAISGAILDYEREDFDKENSKKEDKIKDDDDKDDDDDDKDVKSNNGNKDNNGKGNKK